MNSGPDSARWFVGDLVFEIRVGGDPRAVVQVSTRLIGATSTEEAFEQAVALGHEEEDEYLNPAGALVVTRFRGLAGLDLVHDELGHGAELFFSEQVGLAETEIASLLRQKGELNAFAGRIPPRGPDYRVAEIVAEVTDRTADAGDPDGRDVDIEGPGTANE